MSMYDYINGVYGYPDVIFNNATMTAMGAVEEVPLQIWDKSHLVEYGCRGQGKNIHTN